ncbi:ATP-dependent RNA helicase dbp4 [Coemansia furcata]|uniref:ATP-dependent RNA helicase dbp4 n=1 Tax=Coemansia furcata TaxID=417177 RepID=A0ACC1LDH8_9FUNG|nr:ATP-dependent RNA helicase dbp4 [Coemansia furcata]
MPKPKSSSKKDKQKKAEFVSATDKRKQRRSDESQVIEKLGERALEIVSSGPLSSTIKLFTELPISAPTLKGLERSHFVEMTEIQHKALPYALARRDVLGAAKTGSGKTLAFLIPILEGLYRSRWTRFDGLGALVISPTRELAMQIFEVLCKIGRYHKFSAGLVIGGKKVDEEKEILSKMNILVCTPGRLLQHMDETAGFDCNNLQVLVLDEADRILDMGFKKTMNAIIANLPRQRQTLLFSATQTKSVKDLARLSLERPEYVGVHEKDKFSTPSKLSQYYMVVDLPQKLDILFSFMKTHVKSKMIIFLSSGKQVRFVYETFCKIQPGIPLLHLHGKQKQMRRVEIFERFMKMTKAALFCTDIASRGLDFPAVDWVVQVDCPEDCDTYLHRVGRTARYDAAGKGLLLLTPGEAPAMGKLLAGKNIPIKEISAKSNKVMTVAKQLQHFCFQDPEIKYLGQRAFVTYVRSVFLQKNKSVFDVDSLPLDEFAESLGLPGAPKIKFVKKTAAASGKNKSYEFDNLLSPEEREKLRQEHVADIERENAAVDVDSDDDEDESGLLKVKSKTRVEKMFARKNAGVLTDHYQRLVDHSGGNNDDDDDDADFITLKRADHALSDNSDYEDMSSEEEEPVVKVIAVNPDTGLPVVIPNIPSQEMSKRQLRKVKEKIIKNTRNTKVIFDDDGNARSTYELMDEESFRKQGDMHTLVDEFQQRNRSMMEEIDVGDREVARQKRKEKRVARKIREREEMEGTSESVAVLKTSDDEDVSMYSGSDDEESADEAVAVRPAAHKRASASRYDAGEDSESAESDAEVDRSHKKRRQGRVLEVDDSAMSLEDQEKLALRLLGAD